MKRIYLSIQQLPNVKYIVTDQLPGYLIVNQAADQSQQEFPFRLHCQLSAAQIRRLLGQYNKQCEEEASSRMHSHVGNS